MIFVGREVRVGAKTFNPSASHGGLTPSSAASVGTMSIDSMLAVTILPLRWPDRLMKRGTDAMSAKDAAVGCLNERRPA